MYYAQGSALESLGLKIHGHVEEAVRSLHGVCSSCTEKQAPLGLDSKRELAAWAARRATLAPIEPLTAAQRQVAFPGSSHGKCAVCNAQLLAVIGLPTNLLELFLRGWDAYWLPRVQRFLETRFVILLCHRCASSDAELVISMDEIKKRYTQVRNAFAAEHFDVAPAYADAITDRIFEQLAAEIRTRDAATA
jgi:hypothetical protein